MKILVFDNYDSFTYNLVHIVRELGYGGNTEVRRNNRISLDDVAKFDKILLSPGPGLPSEAGIMPQLIATYGPSRSILGVCLGHQGIAEAYGARIFNMPTVLHGVATRSIIRKKDEMLFKGLPESFMTCRYHSWSVVPESVNGELDVTAVDENGNIMGISHKNYDVRGVQFHPESILTEHGIRIMQNWLEG